METASLRLKFSPIIKDILHNNSKCCLEIVPEVSSIQNIDKIEWKRNCDFVEYIIPMTYKIILKKKESEIMDTTDRVKTYHSCVEFLTPSSSSIKYASGDVKRIFSDTFISTSMTSYYEEDFERKINKLQPKSKDTNDQGKIVIAHTEKKKTSVFLDTIVSSGMPLDNIQECLEEINVDSKNDEFINDTTHEMPPAKEMYNKQSYQDCAAEITEFYKDDVEIKLNKIKPKSQETNVRGTTHKTPPEYDIDKKPSYKDIAIEITESLHKIPIETLKNIENSKRLLSVTPICSINTNDKSFAETLDVFSLNSVICRMFGSEKVHSPISVVPRQEYLVKQHIVAYESLALGRVENLQDLSVSTSSYSTNQEGPETRVAEFVKNMEAELLPLKVMLHDILTKCATLGLLQNKLIASIKTDQANTNSIVEKQSKSNRVVYTVVFDG